MFNLADNECEIPGSAGAVVLGVCVCLSGWAGEAARVAAGNRVLQGDLSGTRPSIIGAQPRWARVGVTLVLVLGGPRYVARGYCIQCPPSRRSEWRAPTRRFGGARRA